MWFHESDELVIDRSQVHILHPVYTDNFIIYTDLAGVREEPSLGLGDSLTKHIERLIPSIITTINVKKLLELFI